MTFEPTRRHLIATAGIAALLPHTAFAQDVREVVDMTLGDPDAPVTLIEYASFTCPHCASFHNNVLPEIKKNFVDTGKVKLVYREVYFDRSGLWAGMIARCAPEERYFGIADVIYRTQGEWTRGATPEETIQNLFRIGKQAGMTEEDMNTCMSDRPFAEALVAEYQKNTEADGITSTPSFVLNGEKVSNMSYPEFEERLNEALGG